ncbi:uncharacterized protein LOC144216647 [Crocuta crocuta]
MPYLEKQSVIIQAAELLEGGHPADFMDLSIGCRRLKFKFCKLMADLTSCIHLNRNAMIRMLNQMYPEMKTCLTKPGLHPEAEQTTLGDGLIIACGRTCLTFIKKSRYRVSMYKDADITENVLSTYHHRRKKGQHLVALMAVYPAAIAHWGRVFENDTPKHCCGDEMDEFIQTELLVVSSTLWKLDKGVLQGEHIRSPG